MAHQLRLPLDLPPPPIGQHPESAAPGGPARIIRAAWLDLPPPTEAELTRAAEARDTALAEWQRASAEFDALEPPLPVRWDNWREAKAREKRKRAATADAAAALEAARANFRLLICRQSNGRSEPQALKKSTGHA